MPRVLLAWVGSKDLDGTGSADPLKAGPICRALVSRRFDHVVLLNDYAKERAEKYERWLKRTTKVDVVIRNEKLSSPTNYRDIYRAVSEAVVWTREKYGKKATLTFHLSPGTPAMAAIWIIAAKTQFEAELIESSPEQGVATVDVPFSLHADFIPAAVQQTSEDLARMAEGGRPEDATFGDIHHRSSVMKHLVKRARQAAMFSEPILIEGESGTGKQLLAAAIHREGPRKGGPLIEENCGAVPRELFESVFFGHMKGAFTGAATEHKGHFERANGGTLFLDEVGELTLDHQVKLLRVLQEKKVRRLNGTTDIPVDVRVIAATNRDLLKGVAEGWFREDLYFRLAVLVLKLPPLRTRSGDLPLLLDKLLERVNSEHGARPGAVQKKLSPGARSVLLRHLWPGNVRELDATLRRACIWSKAAVIEEDEAREAIVSGPVGPGDNILGRPLGEGFSLEGLLEEVARHYLTRAMKEAGGVKKKATELIGFDNYQTLTNWLDKYEVKT